MAWNQTLQPQIVERLQKVIERNRLAHAYIFFGAKGTGKREMAYELAKTINCEVQGEEACGTCTTCLQIEHKNHPDVISIQPDGAFIRIAQLRDLQARCRLSPPHGFTRVILLEKADRMRDEAANSLLKFIEEPLANTLILLLTEQLSDILPTIQSRCQPIYFPVPSPSNLKEKLKAEGIPASLANLYAHLPQDHDLEERVEDEIYALQDRVVTWGVQVIQGKDQALLTLNEEWMRQEMENGRTAFLLDLFLLWLRDLLFYQIGKEAEIFSAEQLTIANQHSSDFLHLAIENVFIARRLLVKPGFSEISIVEQMILGVRDHQVSMVNDWRLIPIAK